MGKYGNLYSYINEKVNSKYLYYSPVLNLEFDEYSCHN